MARPAPIAIIIFDTVFIPLAFCFFLNSSQTTTWISELI
jgi:aromatic ring hydroxylase